MERIRDKSFLLLFGLFLVLLHDGDLGYLAALLACFCITCFYEYTNNILLLQTAAGIYLGIMICFPFTACFFPILLYDLTFPPNWFFSVPGGVIYLIFLSSLAPYDICLGIIFIGVAVILEYSTRNYIYVAEEIKRQRDTSRELELLLKQKNKSLIEKQDYEVHLATLKERNRIAREIHDNVGHMLSRSILQTGALKAVAKESELQEQIQSLSQTLNQAMDSIRKSVHDLHDESLDLHDTLNQLISDYPDFEIKTEYDLAVKTPKEIKYCFLTVVREALSNVIRHSNADKIFIALREFDSFYQLIFEDNGDNYQKKVMTGIGLDSMKERVNAFHGTFHLQTESGVKIFITIPK